MPQDAETIMVKKEAASNSVRQVFMFTSSGMEITMTILVLVVATAQTFAKWLGSSLILVLLVSVQRCGCAKTMFSFLVREALLFAHD
mmetsp:Transcript_16241/g.24546  ORF Transcript_16241/g.24546 Transcript_16241/m.24546 type:complete len:87 (-) Transcript_16241:2-262(-)